jgi:hypothetical protein
MNRLVPGWWRKTGDNEDCLRECFDIEAAR